MLVPATVVPPIVTELVVEVALKAPVVAVIGAAALVSSVVFANRVTEVDAVTPFVRLIVVPVEVIATLEPVEVMVAPVAFVIAAEPEMMIAPPARIAPVGATEVPPEIASVVPAVRAPAPT